MYLIFDTETTGLPKKWNAPITDTDNWPRCVQLAWQLHDSNGKIIVEGMTGNNEIISLIDDIKKKVETLPNILPATKTNLGIAVKSKIKLPIIFKSD